MHWQSALADQARAAPTQGCHNVLPHRVVFGVLLDVHVSVLTSDPPPNASWHGELQWHENSAGTFTFCPDSQYAEVVIDRVNGVHGNVSAELFVGNGLQASLMARTGSVYFLDGENRTLTAYVRCKHTHALYYRVLVTLSA